MGEHLLDRGRAALRAEIEQEPGDATRHIQQHEPADLLVGAPEAAGQLREQRPRDHGVRLHASPEVLAPQDEELRVVHRNHVCGARLVVDQGELTEMSSGLEHSEDDLSPVLADQDDLDPAGPDDEE